MSYSSTLMFKMVFHRKEILPASQLHLWKIESGVGRIVIWNEVGTQVTLGFCTSGDIVGKPLSCQPTYQVECLTPLQVSKVNMEDAGLYPSLYRQLEEREQLLGILNHASMAERLWELLLWLSNRFGKPMLGGQTLGLKLTHQELAETIHTSRVTVTRLLGQFAQEQKIRYSRQGILLNPQPRSFDARQSA